MTFEEARATIEHDNPDFAFLPGLVDDAVENQGLTLPTASSMVRARSSIALASEFVALRLFQSIWKASRRRSTFAVRACSAPSR